MERDREKMVRYLQQRYWYDRTAGVVRNRKGQVINGFDNGRGYLKFDARFDGNRFVTRLHHLVWVLVYGRFPKLIDHINGNPKDNRIENLREVSQSENDMNRVFSWKPNPSTGLPGVYKVKGVCKVKVQDKQLYFHDKYEAFHELTMLGRMWNEECGIKKTKKIMIAKNNIFNIRAGRAQWLGMTGTCKGFVEFETREHGIRAWLVLMRNYRHKYGCRTIRQIVSRFAPPSENNTERYIRYCCQVVVVGDGTDISQDIMYAMLGVAMARMETGVALDISEVREVMKKYHITIV